MKSMSPKDFCQWFSIFIEMIENNNNVISEKNMILVKKNLNEALEYNEEENLPIIHNGGINLDTVSNLKSIVEFIKHLVV